MSKLIDRGLQRCNETRSYLDADLQWCLSFEKKLSHIECADHTPCILHGRIFWSSLTEDLNRIESARSPQGKLKSQIRDDSAMIESGIYTTLGDLISGTIAAQLTLEYTAENRYQQIYRNISWGKICHIPLKTYIKTVQGKITKGTLPDTKTVIFSRNTSKSGVQSQKGLKYKAALAVARGVPLADISQNQVNSYLAREVPSKKQYIKSGSHARLSLYNGHGEVVESKIIVACE